jgi:hypothetical protein
MKADVWRAARAPAAFGLLVIVVAVVLAALTDRTTRADLDPTSVSEYGSRAVARLLQAEGVEVDVAHVGADVADAGPDATVLVPFPERLASSQLDAIRRSGADVVVVAPDQSVVTALAPRVQVADRRAEVDERPPGCGLPAAVRAGAVDLGGMLYRVEGATACYPAEGGNALVQLVDAGRTVTVIGSPDVLMNGALAREGNASLALALLGGRPRLLWFLPVPEGPPAGRERSLGELVPPGWRWAALQLVVAAGLAIIWRARRLGPVVAEPLPVVVRGAEAVEGRARLYRRAGAREHAADVLRRAATARMAPLLGLPDPPDRAGLTAAIAERTGRQAAGVDAALYGPAPSDDAALIALADTLDDIEAEVRRA